MRIGSIVIGLALLSANAHTQGLALGPVAFQPVQDGSQIDPNFSCIVCHAEKRNSFRLGVHSERGMRCQECHGGDPTAFEQGPAHSGPSYIGAPDKFQTVELCTSCHSDPDRMRQYGLRVGQLVEFRTSKHGQLLLEAGDDSAPTCSDCHNSHTILPPNDARSNVYPSNIVKTCARCHEDDALMAKYGLGTDQINQHRQSAHGVALFDEHNFAAPTCVGCHGSHAALPPTVPEISNVCGRCHALVRRAFYEGPHGSAAQTGALPGCTACHSNHGTERVPPDRIAATCTECHDPDSPAALAGQQVQEDVTGAMAELTSAEEAIQELVRSGHQVAEMRFRYTSALTAYRQMDLAQHSLDLQRIEDLAREVSSISSDIRAEAEVSAEHKWEHKLILIPVWFLALSGAVLAWFRLRALGRGES